MGDAIPGDATAFLRELITRAERSTLSRLKRSTPDSLYWQPDPEANSIGVTIWHYTRWFDLLGTVTLAGGAIDSQHWFRDGWMAKTRYDPRGIGFGGLGLITGYTIPEMLAVPHLSAAELGEYHGASAASLAGALAHDDAKTLMKTLRFVDTETTRHELVFSTLLGVNRHLGEIDALMSLHARQATRASARPAG